jgi:prevent-host-death family protein
MKRASVTEAKNQLSALLDRVRHGETIVIEDRGVPIARLEPLATRASAAGEGRLERLERQGIATRPAVSPPGKVLAAPPPKPRGGARASRAIADERREGR